MLEPVKVKCGHLPFGRILDDKYCYFDDENSLKEELYNVYINKCLSSNKFYLSWKGIFGLNEDYVFASRREYKPYLMFDSIYDAFEGFKIARQKIIDNTTCCDRLIDDKIVRFELEGKLI